MSLAIETRRLTRDFGGVCAVDSVGLSVPRGTFYGFLGPNGAGKSTTIKMLTGLLAPSAGEIRVLGRNTLVPAESLEVKRRIGVAPEGLALFDNLTGPEYLTFIGRMHLLPPETIPARSRDLMNLLRLDDAGRKLTLEYSHVGNLASMLAPFPVAGGTLKPAAGMNSKALVNALFGLTMPFTRAPSACALGLELLADHFEWGTTLPLYLLGTLGELVLLILLYRQLVAPFGALLHRREQRIMDAVTVGLE